jgi:hypothetical protein
MSISISMSLFNGFFFYQRGIFSHPIHVSISMSQCLDSIQCQFNVDSIRIQLQSMRCTSNRKPDHIMERTTHIHVSNISHVHLMLFLYIVSPLLEGTSCQCMYEKVAINRQHEDGADDAKSLPFEQNKGASLVMIPTLAYTTRGARPTSQGVGSPGLLCGVRIL